MTLHAPLPASAASGTTSPRSGESCAFRGSGTRGVASPPCTAERRSRGAPGTDPAGRCDRGMTLIEIGVALCVAGLMLAVAIPAMSPLTRPQLRQRTGQLPGGIHALYGDAALEGHTCRLV